MNNFGWCFIGCGNIAESAAKAVTKGNHRIVSVYGRTFEKAKLYAEKYGATAYETVEEALKDPRVDGVYIATTNESHGYYTKLAVSHGRPVLCEKPFAMNEAEAKEVLAFAEEKGVYVAEAMWTWHNPVSLQVREWISEGKIGKVTGVESCYTFDSVNNGKPTKTRLFEPALGGGALMDIGIYPLRYIYELFGRPQGIIARGELYNGIDLTTDVEMKYDGFTASFHSAISEPADEFLTITGTLGTISVPFFHKAYEARLNDTVFARGDEDYQRSYLYEFDNTAEDILGGKTESNYISHEATLCTMAMLDECRKQMHVIFPGE